MRAGGVFSDPERDEVQEVEREVRVGLSRRDHPWICGCGGRL